MIESSIFYTLTCDSCGERMDLGDENGYLVTESIAEAEEMIGNRDWLKSDDGKLECQTCVEESQCGMAMVGSGPDTFDPCCELRPGHVGPCRSTAAIDQNLITTRRLAELRAMPPPSASDADGREG